jgi:hypothetical protein
MSKSTKRKSNPRNSKKILNQKRSKLRKNTRKKSRAHSPVKRRRTNINRRGSQKGGAGLGSTLTPAEFVRRARRADGSWTPAAAERWQRSWRKALGAPAPWQETDAERYNRSWQRLLEAMVPTAVVHELIFRPENAIVMVALLASAYATRMGMQAAWRAASEEYRRLYPLPREAAARLAPEAAARLAPEAAGRRLFGIEAEDAVAPAVAPPVVARAKDQAAIDKSWADYGYGSR